jgi:hypothetical protein
VGLEPIRGAATVRWRVQRRLDAVGVTRHSVSWKTCTQSGRTHTESGRGPRGSNQFTFKHSANPRREAAREAAAQVQGGAALPITITGVAPCCFRAF